MSGKGIMKVFKVSEAMSKVLSKSEASRPEINKILWKYIKEENLQNEKNKKLIKVNEKLKNIFPHHNEIDMFAMQKEISKHIIKN